MAVDAGPVPIYLPIKIKFTLEVLVDVCARHPTAATYITHYALSVPGQCVAGAIIIDNRKIGIHKPRLEARTGYAFDAFGAATYGTSGDTYEGEWTEGAWGPLQLQAPLSFCTIVDCH